MVFCAIGSFVCVCFARSLLWGFCTALDELGSEGFTLSHHLFCAVSLYW